MPTSFCGLIMRIFEARFNINLILDFCREQSILNFTNLYRVTKSMGSYRGGSYLEYPQTILFNYPCPVGTAPALNYHSVTGDPPLPKRVKTEPLEDLNIPFYQSLTGEDASLKASTCSNESPKFIEFITSQPYSLPSRSSCKSLVDLNPCGKDHGLKSDFTERNHALAGLSDQFVLQGHIDHSESFVNGCSPPICFRNPALASSANFTLGETSSPSNNPRDGESQFQLLPCTLGNFEANPPVAHLTLARQSLLPVKLETQDHNLYSWQLEDSISIDSDVLELESHECEQDSSGGLPVSIEDKDSSDEQLEFNSPSTLLFNSQTEMNQCMEVTVNEQETDDNCALMKPQKLEGGISCAKDLRRESIQNTLVTFEELRSTCAKELKDFVPVDMAGFRRRADLKAASVMRGQGLWLSSQKVIGNIPGVHVGDTFNFRIELCILGLHRQHRAGIDYITANNSAFNKAVATSVVIGTTEQYGDDMDMGETVIYTGQGGMPRGAKEGDGSAQDQKLVRGNIALKNSFELHIPVRVIRGYRLKNKRSGTVYSYDGLYLVNGMKYELGFAGNYVFKFLLQRMKNQLPLTMISSQRVHAKPLPYLNSSLGPKPLMIEGPYHTPSNTKISNSSISAKERHCADGQSMVDKHTILNDSLPAFCPCKPHELTLLERAVDSNTVSPCLVQVMMPAPYSRALNLIDLRNYSSPVPGYGVPFFQGPRVP